MRWSRFSVWLSIVLSSPDVARVGSFVDDEGERRFEALAPGSITIEARYVDTDELVDFIPLTLIVPVSLLS